MRLKPLAALASIILATCAGATTISYYGGDPIEIPDSSSVAQAITNANDAAAAANAAAIASTNYVNNALVQVAEANPTATQYEVFRMILADLWDKYERLAAFEGYDNVEDAIVSVMQDTISELQSGMTNYVTAATLNGRLNSYVPTSRTINGKNLTANRSLTASDVGAVSEQGGSVYSMGTISDGNTEYFYPSYAFKTYYYESSGSFEFCPYVFESCPVYVYVYPQNDGTISFSNCYYYDMTGSQDTSASLTAYAPVVFEVVAVYYDVIVRRIR